MFDFDEIEKDWLDNSFCLTDEEIRKIYISEGVTTKAYAEAEAKFNSSLPSYNMTTEERLLLNIFGTEEEKRKVQERINEINKRREEMLKHKPKRPYLSQESQMRVVEGSMDIVFKIVRKWNAQYEKFPIEDLYYAALEGLIAAAKYCLHFATKNSFRAYAQSYIYKQLIKCMARKEHISYRNAYCIVSGGFEDWNEYAKENRANYSVQGFSLDYDMEVPYKPSSIHYMRKDMPYSVDYTRRISNEEFIHDYLDALEDLSENEAQIMRLSYDIDGNPGLTYGEISDFYGIKKSKINYLKRKARKKLRFDDRIIRYRY